MGDHGLGLQRLRSVPCGLGCIELGRQGGVELLSRDQPLQLLTRRSGGEPQQPAAIRWAQCFPGLSERMAWKISWMIELSFSGLRAISSDAAAMTIQKAG